MKRRFVVFYVKLNNVGQAASLNGSCYGVDHTSLLSREVKRVPVAVDLCARQRSW